MRSFLLTVVLLLASGVGIPLLAHAEAGRGTSKSMLRHRYEGPRISRDGDENRSHRRRLARAVYSDVYDDHDDDDREEYVARRHRSHASHHHARRSHHAQHRRAHSERRATRHHATKRAARHHASKSRHARRHRHGHRYAEHRSHRAQSRHERRSVRRDSPGWARHAVGHSHGSGRTGVASYYWQGQLVASGGRFNPDGMTAAHRSLPFGTRVRVTHLSNGRSVTVRINDRGPFVAGRIIDLSRGAAKVIGMTAQGVARVMVEVLGR